MVDSCSGCGSDRARSARPGGTSARAGMTMRSLAWIAVVAVSGTAAAQPASESATASMLEHEVDAQLAARGLVLSRRGLALQLEQLGGPWLVSLVDLTT